MATRKSVFIYSKKFEKFSYPASCPFNVSRAPRLRKILSSLELLSGDNISEVAPEPADRLVLKKFHSARYLHALKVAARGKFEAEAFSMGIGTADCPAFADMYDYSVLACGATVAGAKLILSGKAGAAFNPSGGLHHAGPERASGFCYLNDVALGCMVLAEAGKKVLYLDVDVHHGDGVANAFYDSADVMTISFHESGRVLFPGTGFASEIGKGKGKGYCVNVPLPPGTYDKQYMKGFKVIAVPLIKSFKPDVFVFELGADGLAGDPLAHFYLTNNTYAEIISILLGFAKPILMTGGGGYNIDNTVRAWARAWAVLCGADRHRSLQDEPLTISSQQREIVDPQVEAAIKAVKDNVFSFHKF
ncbi:MAG: acetoin utilization protein AcuC [Planctomycetota bacterium]